MSNTEPIKMYFEYEASVDQLWSALTDHLEMVNWYFENIPTFIPEVGFETKFPVQSKERTFTHLWKVLEVIPNQLISYSWRYTEYPGEAKVSFIIEANDSKVQLTLLNEGLHTFPKEIPEFTRESCKGGWAYFLEGRLRDYLSK